MPGYRVGLVIYRQQCRKRRPIVAVEDRPSEEADKPRPACVLVVVRRDVKAEPAASALHVFRKRRPLAWSFWEVIQPEDQLEPLERARIQFVPVGRGLQREIVPLG